ncbi:unnamed protein product [Euphydryas editha]|uniref:Uncharacterized protein n=1 Tax=Euphydryas editha TaxID=104508 RepID=A0AAU9UPH6_EUPED|nr:unnamed protein product [Euphydryas editha]
MSSSDNESLEDEIKELLENYKFKKATIYEPCTLKNLKECLIGLSEEFNLINIDYVFNPYVDIENNTLSPEALVKLVNSAWTLLHHFKNVSEKVENLEEQNHILESNNKQVNHTIGRLKKRLNTEKNESKACIASALRVTDQSNDIYQKLLDTKMKLTQLTKQKETNEKCLHNKIARLKLENDKLLDRLRNKSAPKYNRVQEPKKNHVVPFFEWDYTSYYFVLWYRPFPKLDRPFHRRYVYKVPVYLSL